MSIPNTLKKIKLILNNRNINQSDMTIIEEIKLIFINNANGNIQFPDVKNEYNTYIFNIIDIIYDLLQKDLKEREKLYASFIETLNDEKIKKKLNMLKNIPTVADNLANNKLKYLYNIIY